MKFILNIFFILSIICLNLYASKKMDIKITTFDRSEVSKTANKINNVRMSFLDLRTNKKIGIREIDLDGKTTNFIPMPKKLLNSSFNYFRWGSVVQYNPKNDSFFLGLSSYGIVEFSRSAKIINEYKLNNISHELEITSKGNLLFPYSWSKENENQVTEIDIKGNVVWSWSASKFIKKHNLPMSISHREPDSYVASTGATELNPDTIIATLSQGNAIVYIDKKTGNVLDFINFSENSKRNIRPHTPVVHEGKLIAYSYRKPNSLKLWDFEKDQFNDIKIIDNNAVKKNGGRLSRSLSLQYLGKNQYFVSNVTKLRQLNADGKEIWVAQTKSIKPLWKGFHSVVRYELKD